MRFMIRSPRIYGSRIIVRSNLHTPNLLNHSVFNSMYLRSNCGYPWTFHYRQCLRSEGELLQSIYFKEVDS